MAPNRDEGHRLLNQLFTLDVSTLITNAPSGGRPLGRVEPTGEKAPPMQTMVQNLADRYSTFATGKDGSHFSDASKAAKRRREAQSDPRHGLLDRVTRNGQDLHDIVNRTGEHADGKVTIDEKKLTPADAATIRKAWELSLDPVDIGTNVSLEGDVLTRFSSINGRPPAPEVERFHGEMVNCGLDQWRSLMGVVTQFITTLLGFFLR